MMDLDTRVNLVTSRACARRRVKAKRDIAILSSSSTVLGVCLFALVTSFAAPEAGSVVGLYGSSLLFDQAGGYILVGLVSFALAVLVTLGCVNYRRSVIRRKGDGGFEKDEDHE